MGENGRYQERPLQQPLTPKSHPFPHLANIRYRGVGGFLEDNRWGRRKTGCAKMRPKHDPFSFSPSHTCMKSAYSVQELVGNKKKFLFVCFPSLPHFFPAGIAPPPPPSSSSRVTTATLKRRSWYVDRPRPLVPPSLPTDFIPLRSSLAAAAAAAAARGGRESAPKHAKSSQVQLGQTGGGYFCHKPRKKADRARIP